MKMVSNKAANPNKGYTGMKLISNERMQRFEWKKEITGHCVDCANWEEKA